MISSSIRLMGICIRRRVYFSTQNRARVLLFRRPKIRFISSPYNTRRYTLLLPTAIPIPTKPTVSQDPPQLTTHNTQTHTQTKLTMVYLTTSPATLTSYAHSCRAYLNTHRSGVVHIINELSAVCTELEKLAAEIDQHSLRLSYGNCSHRY